MLHPRQAQPGGYRPRQHGTKKSTQTRRGPLPKSANAEYPDLVKLDPLDHGGQPVYRVDTGRAVIVWNLWGCTVEARQIDDVLVIHLAGESIAVQPLDSNTVWIREGREEM